MDRELVKEILTLLGKKRDIRSTEPLFADKRYKPVRFSTGNFQAIKPGSAGRKICCVDGSNMELIAAPDFSVQLIRTCAVVYKDNKREGMKRDEFYVLVSTKGEGEGMSYSVQTYPDRTGRIELDMYDETMRTGRERVVLGKVGELVRSLAEVEVKRAALSELGEGDMIIRDGCLEPKLTLEEEMFKRLFDEAKDVVLLGLSKTTDMLTDSGQSLPGALNAQAPDGAWMYYPLAESKTDLGIGIVKLHRKSAYTFRLDFLKQHTNRIGDACNELAHHSCDPVFIGYPYGLVEAHRGAKISGAERQQLLTVFKARAGKDWQKIESGMRAADAHEVLDRT